jgi:hypothetical protein
MIDLKVTVRSDGELDSIRQQIAALPGEAFDYFRSVTPIRTGNARRRTRLSGDTIRADYAYAQPLDDGRSRQAPRGMTEPTEKWLARRVKQIKGK